MGTSVKISVIYSNLKDLEAMAKIQTYKSREMKCQHQYSRKRETNTYTQVRSFHNCVETMASTRNKFGENFKLSSPFSMVNNLRPLSCRFNEITPQKVFITILSFVDIIIRIRNKKTRPLVGAAGQSWPTDVLFLWECLSYTFYAFFPPCCNAEMSTESPVSSQKCENTLG